MKILIFTEGGEGKGFGHVARCVALYHGFKENGFLPEIIVDGDDSVEGLLKGTAHSMVDWINEKESSRRILSESDIAVVDSYLAGMDFYNEVSAAVRSGVYIDDNNRLDYPKGMILNGNIYAGSLNYTRHEKKIYLLGPSYSLIRKEFWAAPKKNINKTVQTALITMGGCDTNNAAGRALKIMAEHFPSISKKVLIGKGFKYTAEIKKIADRRTAIVCEPDAGAMKRAMEESDVAVSAGGQTLYELARLGVPSVAICLAGNQRLNLEAWEKTGFVRFAGGGLEKGILEGMAELASPIARSRRSRIAQDLVDGLGALKAAREVLNAV